MTIDLKSFDVQYVVLFIYKILEYKKNNEGLKEKQR